MYAVLSTQKRASWFGTRISKSFVGSATVADDDAGALWDELLTSLREFEELEAIHEELDTPLELRTTFGEELLLDGPPPLRSEDDEIVESVEDDDVGASTDDDTATVADDDVRTVAELDELLLNPVDELVELSLELRMTVCDELFTSLREFEELEAIHEELIKFSDCALNILSEFSSEQATKSSEQIGRILYKFISKPIKEYTGGLV